MYNADFSTTPRLIDLALRVHLEYVYMYNSTLSACHRAGYTTWTKLFKKTPNSAVDPASKSFLEATNAAVLCHRSYHLIPSHDV